MIKDTHIDTRKKTFFRARMEEKEEGEGGEEKRPVIHILMMWMPRSTLGENGSGFWHERRALV